MLKVIGFDSREFKREVIKSDGSRGKFRSAVGFGIRVDDYDLFDKKYKEILEKVMLNNGIQKEYNYYCVNDLKNLSNVDKIVEEFILEIEPFISRVHVFYTLFSPKRKENILVYGRYSRNNRLKLAKKTRTYQELLDEHIINMFPEICAWRLCECVGPPLQFHLDSFSGHINGAHEELERKNIQKIIFPSGDCINPVISTADLFLHFFDKRLEKSNLFLIFDNIRKAIPEYGEKVLAYPISNKHLSNITPLDKEPVQNLKYYRRPIYWIFKGNIQMDSGEIKRSNPFRLLLDGISSKGGTIRMFDENKDSKEIREGDYGVYFNDSGKENVLSYRKMGKKIIPFSLDLFIPEENRNL